MNGRRSIDGAGRAGSSGVGDGRPGPPSSSPGWRYTLRVPSWSQAQLPDGETAVFFQVGSCPHLLAVSQLRPPLLWWGSALPWGGLQPGVGLQCSGCRRWR
jgi:hypothetical protein